MHMRREISRPFSGSYVGISQEDPNLRDAHVGSTFPDLSNPSNRTQDRGQIITS